MGRIVTINGRFMTIGYIYIMVCFSFLSIGANATPVLDEDGTELVGDNGAGLVALVEELPGDVVTVSIQLKGTVNITTIQSVRLRFPNTVNMNDPITLIVVCRQRSVIAVKGMSCD